MTDNDKDAVESARLEASLVDKLTALVEGRLWLQVMIGLVLGVLTGIVIGPGAGILEPATGVVVGNWLALPGRLFLVSIQMIVVPLVFASIVLGLTGGGSAGQARRVATWALAFFVTFTAVAAALGIWLTVMFEPGQLLAIEGRQLPVGADGGNAAPPLLTRLPDMVVGLLPGNPLNALVQGQMLQIVLFGFIVGAALQSLPGQTGKPLIDLLHALQEVCMTVVRWAMLLAPWAVFGLMAQLTSRTGLQTLIGLSAYVAVVLGGLLLLVVLYLTVLRVASGRSPFAFLRDVRELLLLAFSTSSSAAVMPLTMRTARETLGVRDDVVQMVVPLGTTVNMNGTALYQAVAAVFLAQVYGVDVSIAGLAMIVAMAVGASIGSPATPGVGIVILASILSGIGVPAEGIALIIGVDRLLDMCRTSVNVLGDVVASCLVDRFVPAEAVLEDETPQQTG